jgi:hypothetical protein
MARGRALVTDVLPLLQARITPAVDAHAATRLADMCEKYADVIARERSRAARLG